MSKNFLYGLAIAVLFTVQVPNHAQAEDCMTGCKLDAQFCRRECEQEFNKHADVKKCNIECEKKKMKCLQKCRKPQETRSK